MPFDLNIISLKDILDILLVAFILYKTYKVMKSSGSINIFIGILVFIIIWIIVSQVLQMRLLGSIFDKLVSVGVIALIVLFQDEIRQFLLTLGSRYSTNSLLRLLKGKKYNDSDKNDIMPIVMACLNMGKGKVGALIVLEKDMPLDNIVMTGDVIDANINQRLIENIFFKNSPLHDGAMIISGKRIKAAGCILPVSHNLNIPKELGLRHRAALGVSQETDALAIIVSEETGGISIAYKGEFYLKLNAEELERMLTNEYINQA
ncbi:diadenylate cyclase CdaA [uncultured Bacteroides sp.]|uniref:diadenylate cyclase CdaA n=1 Tax=uncultured Bacteroides sp. TaxID=162156 RepID=UPI002623C092|nr:diadenylate cyclase CdaA [uncultured Bacteroides sp.]